MSTNNFNISSKISDSFFFIKKNYVIPRSSSLSYLSYRIKRPFLKVYYKLFNLLKPGRPWTTPASILIFEKVLNENMVGLEYGSGRSTLFFSKHLGKLVSIEHYAEWYKKVNKILEEENINNVDYLYIPKNSEEDIDDNSNEFHNKFTGNEERPEYADYANKVLDYDDNYFDFVLIDGRSRVNCGLNAMAKLKPGGMFVLDNSERKRYQRLHEALKNWPKIETTTGLTNTTIWFKP